MARTGRTDRALARSPSDSSRPAPDALFSENLLALHADTGHERSRTERENWGGLAIAAEIENGNWSANASGRTTVTIRVANAASLKVAVVRGVTVLVTLWRPAYFNFLARSAKYRSMARLINSASGAPVLSDSFCSFLTWSSFKKRAVRFIVAYSIMQAYICP
jgi:hypothetical protein